MKTPKFSMRYHRILPRSVFVAAALWLTGCASTGSTSSDPVERLANQDRVVTVLGGAGLGAGIGAAIGSASGDAGKGAAIGGVIGGIGGAIVGDQAARRRTNLANDRERLEAEIEITQKAIDAQSRRVSELRTTVDEFERQTRELRAVAPGQRADSDRLRRSLDELILENEKILKDYDEAIASLRRIVEDPSVASNEQLREQRDALNLQIAALKSLKAETLTATNSARISRDSF